MASLHVVGTKGTTKLPTIDTWPRPKWREEPLEGEKFEEKKIREQTEKRQTGQTVVEVGIGSASPVPVTLAGLPGEIRKL